MMKAPKTWFEKLVYKLFEQLFGKPVPPPPAPPTDPAPPPAPDPAPTPPTPPAADHPFPGRTARLHRIAKDVLDWKPTAVITKATFSGNRLVTAGTFPRWPTWNDGEGDMQGNFGLAVEQADGSIVIGTWDWDRSPHQTRKDVGHNLSASGEHAFFNLRPGARIWWFITARSRDAQRTVKERSNFYPDTWA